MAGCRLKHCYPAIKPSPQSEAPTPAPSPPVEVGERAAQCKDFVPASITEIALHRHGDSSRRSDAVHSGIFNRVESGLRRNKGISMHVGSSGSGLRGALQAKPAYTNSSQAEAVSLGRGAQGILGGKRGMKQGCIREDARCRRRLKLWETFIYESTATAIKKMGAV